MRKKNNTTTETIDGLCTYEGGYFDIKYMTKQYLEDLAERGSEPAGNGFAKARIFWLNYHYFLKSCTIDDTLRK